MYGGGNFWNLGYCRTMKLILTLLLFVQSVTASLWQTNQYFYWFSGATPAVALTPDWLINIDHATGSVTSVQIGDQTGVLPAYCTTFVNCPTSIQNCEWVRDHKNLYNDTYGFIACRPLTNGITYIQTNMIGGVTQVSWFSAVSRTWISGTVQSVVSEELRTFGDGSKAWFGVCIFQGQQAISGDSGSPVFTADGDYIGAVKSISGVDLTLAYFLYPEAAQYRPASSTTVNLGVLSGLFNSDPDR